MGNEEEQVATQTSKRFVDENADEAVQSVVEDEATESSEKVQADNATSHIDF